MELEIYELKNLLADAAEIGATKALVKVGALSETVSRREAYRQYGEGVVKRWIEEGILEVRKDGGHTSKCSHFTDIRENFVEISRILFCCRDLYIDLAPV